MVLGDHAVRAAERVDLARVGGRTLLQADDVLVRIGVAHECGMPGGKLVVQAQAEHPVVRLRRKHAVLAREATRRRMLRDQSGGVDMV